MMLYIGIVAACCVAMTLVALVFDDEWDVDVEWGEFQVKPEESDETKENEAHN